MQPPAPYADIPYCGRYEMDHAHAPYLIVRSLRDLGLSGWTATLLHWLGRYDGLEEHLEGGCFPDPQLDPACCVRDVLTRHVARWPLIPAGQTLTPGQQRERMEAVIEDLLELDFVACAAYWGRPHRPDYPHRVIWDSLQEDWLWFIQLGPDLATIQQIEGDDHDHLAVNLHEAAAHENRNSIRQILFQGHDMQEGL